MSLCWDTGGMCSDDTGARGSQASWKYQSTGAYWCKHYTVVVGMSEGGGGKGGREQMLFIFCSKRFENTLCSIGYLMSDDTSSPIPLSYVDVSCH